MDTLPRGIDIGAFEFVLAGDVNYDQMVTADDYGTLDANFESDNFDARFDQGDTNDDGMVTADDYGALDATFGLTWS